MSSQPEKLPWRKEHDLDMEGVRSLLEQQFPELAPVSLQLIGEGWDSEAYEVNNRLIFRMSKRAEVVEWQQHERCLLRRYGERLTLPTPCFQWMGTSSEQYPFPFAGYEKLPGIPAIEVIDSWNSLDLVAIARQLGVFLSALHAIPAEDAGACGLRMTTAQDWSDDRLWGHVDKHIADVRVVDTGLSGRLQRWLDTTAPASPPSAQSVPLHGDLGPEHLMIDPATGMLSGVIDWADTCIGPAAGDLIGCVVWFGEDFLYQVLESYSGSFNTVDLPWIIERSIVVALAHIDYGVKTMRSEYLRLGLHTLNHLLPTQP